MSRTLSLAALSTLLLATAVEANAGAMRDTDGYRATTAPPPAALTALAALEAASPQGDDCGIAGYPWLDADGQPVKG